MRKILGRLEVRIWLAIVGTATLGLGTAYTLAQQTSRLSANDTPLAMAQATKLELDKGAAPTDVVSPIKTDMRGDTIPFTIIADNSRHVLASSANLDGQTPLPPVGVFDYTSAHQSDHFTWEPSSGVRLATQVLSYGKAPNDGFIITGQSLKQAENRVATYDRLVIAGWVAIVAWTVMILLWWQPSKARSRR